MENDIIISVVGGLMTLFIAVVSIAMPIVFNRLFKSIDEVRTDLKAHERECRMRDRDLVAKVNWIMGKLGTQVPEPPKPEETEPA